MDQIGKILDQVEDTIQAGMNKASRDIRAPGMGHLDPIDLAVVGRTVEHMGVVD
jgi:hypothetical protein